MYPKPLDKLNSSSTDLIFNYITELHRKGVEENEHIIEVQYHILFELLIISFLQYMTIKSWFLNS